MSSISEKKFVIKHVFTNCSQLAYGRNFGNEQSHFRLKWKFGLCKNRKIHGVFLYCPKPKATHDWSIEVDCELKMVENGEEKLIKKHLEFSNHFKYGLIQEIANIEDYLIDGNLPAEYHVEITKTTGIKMYNWKNFDKTRKLAYLQSCSADVPTSRNVLVMKHVFTDFRTPTRFFGDELPRFGLTWKIEISKDWGCFVFCLSCSDPTSTREWTIEVQCVLRIFEIGKPKVMKRRLKFNSSTRNQIICEIENIEDFLIDGDLPVEYYIKLARSNTDNLRSFDEPKFSDVVLVVEDEEFYVSKLFLASHSTYFEALLFGNFDESKQSVVELKDIDAWDFQNFLELIHGESLVKDKTIDGILNLADMYDAKAAFRRCENFLLNASKKGLKEKFDLANLYKLDNLMKKCVSEMKTVEDLRSIVPKNPDQYSGFVWKELFEKLLSIK